MNRALKRIDITETPRLFERRVVLGMLTSPVVTLAAGVRAEPKPTMKVSKNPNCTCCTAWVEHLRANGFTVTVADTSDIRGVKALAGVPKELFSCHTGEIAGYVVEGHVPTHAIQRCLPEGLMRSVLPFQACLSARHQAHSPQGTVAMPID